jgi:ABC-type amino acid transport substrate-binding protein
MKKPLCSAVTLLVVAAASLAAIGSAAGHPGANLPSSKLISSIQKAGTIRVGVATTPPFIFKDPKTNKYVGPGATLANTLAAKLGVKVQWVPETYDTIIAALQAHQIDLADAPLYATPQRLAVIAMTPWSKDGFCYLVQKKSSIRSKSQLNSPNVTMGNITGTGTYTATAGKYPKAKQVTRVAAPGEQALIPELISGKVDVDPVDATLVQVYLSEYHQLRVVPAGCSATNNPDIPTPIAVGYSKGDSGFATFVKQTVASIQSTLNKQTQHYSAAKYVKAGVTK